MENVLSGLAHKHNFNNKKNEITRKKQIPTFRYNTNFKTKNK